MWDSFLWVITHFEHGPLLLSWQLLLEASGEGGEDYFSSSLTDARLYGRKREKG